MTTETPKKSLLEFASKDRQTMEWVTHLPEWPDCVAGYQAGVRPYTIRNWLIRECGYTDKQLPANDSFARYLRTNYEVTNG